MSKWHDPFSELEGRYLATLRQAEEHLAKRDTQSAAKAVDAARDILSDLADLIFRDQLESSTLSWHGEDKAANVENSLYYKEIFYSRHSIGYSRRQYFIAGALQEKLEALSVMVEDASAHDEYDLAEKGGSLAVPIRFSLERIVRLESFRSPWGVALTGNNILVAESQGGVNILDAEGEHLGGIELNLPQPGGCSAGEDGSAFFIGADSRLVKVSAESGLIMEVNLRDELGLPKGALFNGAGYHGGQVCCTTYNLDPEVWKGSTAVWDETGGGARLVPLPSYCIPYAASSPAGILLLDGIGFTVSAFDSPAAPLFRFDPLWLPMHVKGFANSRDTHFIFDSTTVLACSGSGRLLGKVRPGRYIERWTEITSIAVNEDGTRIYIVDGHNKCLFILNANHIETHRVDS